MIARVAVVPSPPLLVPELVVGHDDDVQFVRDACLSVAASLAEAAGHWVAVAADGTASPDGHATWVGPDAVGTFRGFGVDVPVHLANGARTEPDLAMPLPALVAGWLRGQVGADRVAVRLVSPDLETGACRALGERLAAELAGDDPVGLLVVGDGSHRHGERAVGRPDQRAAGFDEQVHRALAAADPAGLLTLDADLAASLGAIGRAPWQVLAGMTAGERRWKCVDSRLLVPFGVAYHLAIWDPES